MGMVLQGKVALVTGAASGIGISVMSPPAELKYWNRLQSPNI